MFVDEFGIAGSEGRGIIQDVVGKKIDCKGCAFKWLMRSFDGGCKCLSGCDVSGKVSAGDFGFAEEFEENVWGEWECTWSILL